MYSWTDPLLQFPNVCVNHLYLILFQCQHQFLQRDILLLKLSIILEQPWLSKLVFPDLLPHLTALQLQHLVILLRQIRETELKVDKVYNRNKLNQLVRNWGLTFMWQNCNYSRCRYSWLLSKSNQLMKCGTILYVLYLPQLLQNWAQMFIVCLSTGGGGPEVLQFWLELQEATHVVGLLGGTLLQQCLLVRLPVFCHLALGGVGLAKCLVQERRGKVKSSRHDREMHCVIFCVEYIVLYI